MKIIDTTNYDYYDYLSQENNNIVYNRSESVVLSEVNSIFSDRPVNSSKFTTIVVGVFIANTPIKFCVLEKNIDEVELHLTEETLKDIKCISQNRSARVSMIKAAKDTVQDDLVVMYKDITNLINSRSYYTYTIGMKDPEIEIIRNPILIRSVLEYIIPAQELYDLIEEHLEKKATKTL